MKKIAFVILSLIYSSAFSQPDFLNKICNIKWSDSPKIIYKKMEKRPGIHYSDIEFMERFNLGHFCGGKILGWRVDYWLFNFDEYEILNSITITFRLGDNHIYRSIYNILSSKIIKIYGKAYKQNSDSQTWRQKHREMILSIKKPERNEIYKRVLLEIYKI
jgi:hypothetical protein